jgi:hypothetical protein
VNKTQVLATVGWLCGLGYSLLIRHDMTLFTTCLLGLSSALGVKSLFENDSIQPG